MKCVVCGRAAVRAEGLMLAWWEGARRVDEAGVYCAGHEGCLPGAMRRGGSLRDVHAQDLLDSTGTIAFLRRTRRDYAWHPAAWASLVACVLDLQELTDRSVGSADKGKDAEGLK